MITFVTALIDLEEERKLDKPFAKYIELFQLVNQTGVRLHVFASPNYKGSFEVQNGVIEYISLSDLDTYKNAPSGLPDIRTVEHDTRNFLILMNAKSELVKRAIDSNLHTSTHYAWIDMGISHIFRTPSLTLRNLRHITIPSGNVYIPGCWEKQTHIPLSTVHWRFCGGFFLGDKDSLLRMQNIHAQVFPTLSNLSWEVNVWAYMEQQGWNPVWYKADHDDSILNVPYSSGIVRVPSKVPLYWDGGYSRCHVGGAIEAYVQESVSRQSKSVSAVFTQSDGMIEDSEFNKMIESLGREDHANSPANTVFHQLEQSARLGTLPIVCMLCSRNFQKPNILYLPLDDQTFMYGLSTVLSGLPKIPWEQRKPIAFWRGGSSGCERPTLRKRVLDCLFTYPHADVRFTPGGWEHNDKALPPEYFIHKRVGLEEHVQYKYILIVDGNCIASAHQWVFGSGSVPIMITHPGNDYWFKQYLKPMVNYVPIRYDLSDLQEKIDWLVSHDEEAKQIAEQAQYFANTIFTPEFQRAYIDSEVDRIVYGYENVRYFEHDEEFNGHYGQEHYRYLKDIANAHNHAVFFDIGTHKGKSAYALSTNPTNEVYSFDLVIKSDLPMRKNITYSVDNLLTEEGRTRWKDKLLSSACIFLDIDPHEGTREYDFYLWLRDNDYKGSVICDDIWYFKEMRNNFWYKIPSEHKEDISHLGHWSGTGRIQFTPKQLSAPNWTVVTAYFDLTSTADSAPEFRSRNFDYYIEHASTTLSVEQNLVVFCEPEFVERIQAKRPEWLRERTKYITMNFEDFPLNTYRKQIEENRKLNPSVDPRNTISYYLFCMARCSMLKKIAEENPFGSTHFAWLNFCIERMGWKNIKYLNDVFKENRNLFSTCYIDYQPREAIDHVTRHGLCTLCSGFYTGDRTSMLTFCNRMEEKFIELTNKQLGHADEQVINAVYFEDPSLFNVYYGDYAQMITNYCVVRDEPSRPIYQLIKHSYDHQDYQVCLKGCKAVWKSFVEGYCDLSERDATSLLWYYRMSLQHLGLPRKFT